MSDINFSEVVSVVVAGEKPRRMSLARAIREIIAIPQKMADFPLVVLSSRPALRDYAAVVAIYTRPDFPERVRMDRRRKL